MALSPEQTARLLELRRKALDNTVTFDELKEGIQILRQDRVSAQTASTKSRTTKAAAAAPVDASAMLAQLKQLGQKLTSGPVSGA